MAHVSVCLTDMRLIAADMCHRILHMSVRHTARARVPRMTFRARVPRMTFRRVSALAVQDAAGDVNCEVGAMPIASYTLACQRGTLRQPESHT
jgi:hypothetical protein